MSIGLGYMLMTPIQVLMMYQAIANNGVMLKPTFIQYFEDQNGKKTTTQAEVLRNLNIKDSTITAIKRGLRMVVTNGTAKNLATLPVEVSAKTGTAQNSGGNKPAIPLFKRGLLLEFNNPSQVSLLILELRTFKSISG